MSQDRLRALLEELEQELDSLDVKAADRGRIGRLREEIGRIRGADLSPGGAREHAEGLRRAFSALQEFEDRHPSLTGFVTQVSDVLARMGL